MKPSFLLGPIVQRVQLEPSRWSRPPSSVQHTMSLAVTCLVLGVLSVSTWSHPLTLALLDAVRREPNGCGELLEPEQERSRSNSHLPAAWDPTNQRWIFSPKAKPARATDSHMTTSDLDSVRSEQSTVRGFSATFQLADRSKVEQIEEALGMKGRY